MHPDKHRARVRQKMRDGVAREHYNSSFDELPEQDKAKIIKSISSGIDAYINNRRSKEKMFRKAQA